MFACFFFSVSKILSDCCLDARPLILAAALVRSTGRVGSSEVESAAARRRGELDRLQGRKVAIAKSNRPPFQEKGATFDLPVCRGQYTPAKTRCSQVIGHFQVACRASTSPTEIAGRHWEWVWPRFNSHPPRKQRSSAQQQQNSRQRWAPPSRHDKSSHGPGAATAAAAVQQ